MATKDFDIVIKKGKILDGTGNPWYRGDVGIEGDIIKEIGKNLVGRKTIDAAGHIVAPGFIDIHSHSDMPILIDPMAQSKIRQGVTTEVVGQCGNSAAPMYESYMEYRNTYNRNTVPDDFSFDWTTMKSYMDLVEKQGTAVNITPVVGHGTVRMNVMGYENREPNGAELDEMRGLVREAMKDLQKLAADIGIKKVRVVGNKVRNTSDQDLIRKACEGLEILGFLPLSEQIRQISTGEISLEQVDEKTLDPVARTAGKEFGRGAQRVIDLEHRHGKGICSRGNDRQVPIGEDDAGEPVHHITGDTQADQAAPVLPKQGNPGQLQLVYKYLHPRHVLLVLVNSRINRLV